MLVRYRELASGMAFALAVALIPGKSAAQVTHVVANSWQSTDFQDPANPGCSIGGDGSVPGSRLIMGASQRRPAPMSLIIRKPGWAMLVGSRVNVRAAFSDGSTIDLAGRGKGQAIEIDLDGGQLGPWVHSLTANSNMQLVFTTGEPPWEFDLTGTTKVVNAMGDCFAAHHIEGVGPPFSGAVTANAGRTVPSEPTGLSEFPPSPVITKPGEAAHLDKFVSEAFKAGQKPAPTPVSRQLDSIEKDVSELER
jgi:hypothetical protein